MLSLVSPRPENSCGAFADAQSLRADVRVTKVHLVLSCGARQWFSLDAPVSHDRRKHEVGIARLVSRSCGDGKVRREKACSREVQLQLQRHRVRPGVRHRLLGGHGHLPQHVPSRLLQLHARQGLRGVQAGRVQLHDHHLQAPSEQGETGPFFVVVLAVLSVIACQHGAESLAPVICLPCETKQQKTPSALLPNVK